MIGKTEFLVISACHPTIMETEFIGAMASLSERTKICTFGSLFDEMHEKNLQIMETAWRQLQRTNAKAAQISWKSIARLGSNTILSKKLGGTAMTSLAQINSQATKAPVLDQTGFCPLFSSRGTRWGGLVVERTRRLNADCPIRIEISEPHAACILFKTELRWTARGTRYSRSLGPGVGVFLIEDYRLDELTSTTSHYDFITVRLEREKIEELMHDDVRSTRVDFLEHVISNDEQMVGMLHAMFAEAQAGSPAGDLFPSQFQWLF
jgi:hypothetical protein